MAPGAMNSVRLYIKYVRRKTLKSIEKALKKLCLQREIWPSVSHMEHKFNFDTVQRAERVL